ncbi:MAG: gliding motility lipoprotein GldH [Bacteroidales bacterium]
MKTNNRRLQLPFLLLLFSTLIISCGDRVYFSDVSVFQSNEWKSTEVATFTIDIKDNTQPYDINFLIRNSGQYQFANLWLFLTIVDPDNEVVNEKFDCRLAREDGKWLGRHVAGYFDNTVAYKTGYKFEKLGKYTFSFEQGMRVDPLPAINGAGIQIRFSEQ